MRRPVHLAILLGAAVIAPTTCWLVLTHPISRTFTIDTETSEFRWYDGPDVQMSTAQAATINRDIRAWIGREASRTQVYCSVVPVGTRNVDILWSGTSTLSPELRKK